MLRSSALATLLCALPLLLGAQMGCTRLGFRSAEGGDLTLAGDGSFSDARTAPRDKAADLGARDGDGQRGSEICEAVGAGRCYYIDPDHGSDSNDGAFHTPWRTYLNIVSWSAPADATYPDPRSRPTTLGPGDVVYFMSGTYSTSYEVGVLTHAIYLESPTGTADAPIVFAGYPGESPVFATPTTAVFWVEKASYVQVRDLEIADALDTGIFFRGATGVVIDNVKVHGVRHYSGHSSGVDINTSVDVTLSKLEIYDIATPATLAYGLAVFLSTVQVRDCHVWFTDLRDSPCINLIHDGSRIFHNRFEGCRGGVRMSGDDIQIAGNLIRQGKVEVLGDMTNIQILNNTIIDGSFVISPRFAAAAPSAVQFRKNVLIDTETSAFTATSSLITVGAGLSTLQGQAENKWLEAFAAGTALLSDENCLSSTRTAERFSFYDMVEDLATWRTRGYDLASSTEAPALDPDGVATALPCAGYGHDNAP